MTLGISLNRVAPPMISGIRASSSRAIVELSKAPAFKASSIIFLYCSGFFVLPNISLSIISKLSATDAPTPMCPLDIAKAAAVTMFLI